MDFLFKGGNSCEVPELLELQHNPDTRHSMACTLPTPHRAQELMGAPSDPLERQKIQKNDTANVDGPYQSRQDMAKLDFLTGKAHSIAHKLLHRVLGQQAVSAGHRSHTAASCLGIPAFFL